MFKDIGNPVESAASLNVYYKRSSDIKGDLSWPFPDLLIYLFSRSTTNTQGLLAGWRAGWLASVFTLYPAFRGFQGFAI